MIGVVPNQGAGRNEVRRHHPDAVGLDGRDVDRDRCGTGFAVVCHGRGVERGAVDQHDVDEPLAGVLPDRLEVIQQAQVVGFPRLGHQIRDQHRGRRAAPNGCTNAGDQEIGDDRGVQRAGPEHDQVGVLERFDRGGEGVGVGRVEDELGQSLAGKADRRLALVLFARNSTPAQLKVAAEACRQDSAANREDLLCGFDRLVEVPGYPCDGGQEEVAEGVAGEALAGLEAELEEAGEQVLVVGQRDQTVADVARRQQPQVAAQPPGGAAVVGNRDDAGQIGDLGADPALQAGEQRGQPGAAAQGDDAQTGGGTARGRGRNGRPVSRAGGRAARRRPQRLRSSTRISLATAFSVSKTPIPVVATASKVGSRL